MDAMREETNSIYGKPKFGLIVALAGVVLLLLLVAAVLFLRTGHPIFHTQPQPRDNKGQLMQYETRPSLPRVA